MKKFLISSALLSLFASTPVMAVTDIGQSVREEIEVRKAQIKDTQQKLRETAERTKTEVQATRTDAKKERVEFRADIVKHRVTVTSKVFAATLERLKVLSERVESRISKLEAEGKEVGQAQASLDNAKTAMAEAEKHIGIMSALDISITSSTTARTNYDKVKSEAKIVQGFLTDAKKHLQVALRPLKAN